MLLMAFYGEQSEPLQSIMRIWRQEKRITNKRNSEKWEIIKSCKDRSKKQRSYLSWVPNVSVKRIRNYKYCLWNCRFYELTTLYWNNRSEFKWLLRKGLSLHYSSKYLLYRLQMAWWGGASTHSDPPSLVLTTSLLHNNAMSLPSGGHAPRGIV